MTPYKDREINFQLMASEFSFEVQFCVPHLFIHTKSYRNQNDPHKFISEVWH